MHIVLLVNQGRQQNTASLHAIIVTVGTVALVFTIILVPVGIGHSAGIKHLTKPVVAEEQPITKKRPASQEIVKYAVL